MKIFRRKVQRGTKLGRQLGFPTVNCHIGTFGGHFRQGVYLCNIHLHGKSHKGLLYFGLSFGKGMPVLEIHIRNFSQTLYGQWVSFSVGKYLRAPQKFSNTNALKKQMRKDFIEIHKRQSRLRVPIFT